VSELRDSLLLALIPPDSAEDANVVLELRASVGGDWVANFAEDLLDMYRRFAAEQGWRFEVGSGLCIAGVDRFDGEIWGCYQGRAAGLSGWWGAGRLIQLSYHGICGVCVHVLRCLWLNTAASGTLCSMMLCRCTCTGSSFSLEQRPVYSLLLPPGVGDKVG
jgi:hypothetical protein